MTKPAQIFKYPLTEGGRNRVVLPSGFVPLHVAMQDNEIYVWCMVCQSNPDVVGIFHVIGTGWEFNPGYKTYLGTVHSDGFVWHVWSEWEHTNEGNNQQV